MPTIGRGMGFLRMTDSGEIQLTAPPSEAIDINDNITTSFVGSSNPNGRWSYGYMTTAFSNFTLYTSYTTPPTTAFVLWKKPAALEPQIGYNNTSGTLYGVPAGSMTLHPGPSLEPSVLRWTSPGKSKIRIIGDFGVGDTGIPYCAVRYRDSPIYSVYGAGSYNISMTMFPRETLDVVVYGVYNFGSTPFTCHITGTSEIS